MKLRIIRQNGEIGIQSTPAKVHISSKPPRLNIRRRRAELLIRRENSKLIIDNKHELERIGSKAVSRVIEDIARQSVDVCTEATMEIAKYGTRVFKASKTRGEVIKQIIIDRMMREAKAPKTHLPPKDMPKVKFVKGKLEMEWVIYEPEMEWEINAQVDVEVEPYIVEVYLKKKPFLKIIVEDEDKSEFQLSKIVNRKI